MIYSVEEVILNGITLGKARANTCKEDSVKERVY